MHAHTRPGSITALITLSRIGRGSQTGIAFPITSAALLFRADLSVSCINKYIYIYHRTVYARNAKSETV